MFLLIFLKNKNYILLILVVQYKSRRNIKINIKLVILHDKGVKALKDCHTLYLSYTKITDEGVKALKHCHIFNFSINLLIPRKNKI